MNRPECPDTAHRVSKGCGLVIAMMILALSTASFLGGLIAFVQWVGRL